MRLSKVLALSLGLVFCGAHVSMAQSLPNFGPNAPTHGDTFGKPPSGTYAPPSGAKAYAYRAHARHIRRHHRHYRYRH